MIMDYFGNYIMEEVFKIKIVTKIYEFILGLLVVVRRRRIILEMDTDIRRIVI